MARKRTLLLVFIHGFKGGDDTFGIFPEHLKHVLENFMPNIAVKTVVYPRYETRGDLPSAVARFREWLQDLVIDLEDANQSRAPTVDPSVRVVLLAHSMGGIVAADTLISILDDEVVKGPSTGSGSRRVPPSSLDPRKNDAVSEDSPDPEIPEDRILFPAIVGICAFDTPYLGLAPSMFANTAENNIRAASDAFSTVTSVAKSFGFFAQNNTAGAAVATSSTGAPAAALPEAAAAAASSGGGGWGWGKLAVVAGAATAVSAGATAAYWNRSNITEGFSWVTSHLEFVSVLMKGADLKSRVMRVSAVPGVGIANFYTVLGKNAKPVSTPGGKVIEVGGGGLRTFCSLPPKPQKTDSPAPGLSSPQSAKGSSGSSSSPPDQRGATDIDVGTRDLRSWWHVQRNDMAVDEVNAHMYMFKRETNPAYKEMVDGARKEIMKWVINWYDYGT